MAKFGTLAAGALALSTALGSAERADAQATEIRIPLERTSAVGTEIVMDVRNVASKTQTAIMDHLAACIGEAKLSRDECVAQAATLMAEERLQGVVRKTYAQLQPLEKSICLTVAELIQEPVEESICLTVEELIQKPVFCEYAPNATEAEGCTDAIEKVQLAEAQYRLALQKFRLIAAETRETDRLAVLEAVETRVAGVDERIEAAETRETDRLEVLEAAETSVAGVDEEIETFQEANVARRIGNAEQAATIEAQAAVLAALRQVVAETNGTN